MRGAYSACGLELIAPTGPDTMLGKFIEKRGEGLWSVILKVKNMEEAIRKFEEKGLKKTGDVTFGTMREVGFHPKGSFGVEITLAEYPAEHPATWAALDETDQLGRTGLQDPVETGQKRGFEAGKNGSRG